MSPAPTSFRSVLRLQLLFEEGGEPGIFSSPRVYIQRELDIFPCPRAYMEETVRTVTPRNSRRRCIANRLYLKEEERPEFSQVPESI